MTQNQQPDFPDSEQVVSYLRNRRSDIKAGELRLLRLQPLMLEVPVDEFLRRRRRLFDDLDLDDTPYGYSASFFRKLQGGRTITGNFDILTPSEAYVVVASSLVHDKHEHGPERLIERAYPLARKPFIPSTMIRKLIMSFADSYGYEAANVIAHGYERITGVYRQDTKTQPVIDAFEEMEDQGREVDKISVDFRPARADQQTQRFTFGRNGQVTVHKGDCVLGYRNFLVRAVDEEGAQSETYAVPVASRTSDQQVVELSYAGKVFSGRKDMQALADRLKDTKGLSVTIVHLNPYLHVQLLDFLSGSAVDLVVVNERSISLVPRTRDCHAALERVTQAVSQCFGEATAKRAKVKRQLANA
jgi:hypothetical protein